MLPVASALSVILDHLLRGRRAGMVRARQGRLRLPRAAGEPAGAADALADTARAAACSCSRCAGSSRAGTWRPAAAPTSRRAVCSASRASRAPPLDRRRTAASRQPELLAPRHRGARRPGALRGDRARLRRPAAERARLPAEVPARSVRRLHRHGFHPRAARGAGAASRTRQARRVRRRRRADRDRRRASASQERKNARAAFGGRRNIWWDDLDLLYFGGYALWGYVVAPFIFTRPGLPGRGDRAVARERRGVAGPARALPGRAFPPTRASSRYYFGPDGLLRRNDYTAEVFGGWAKAAHYCWDYRDFGGFKIPTRRAAMPRGPARPARCARSRS